jgi:hypothetical protein
VLRNPRYAGAFAFGRTRQRHHGEGKRVTVRKPREEWFTLQQGAHEGYVSWDRYIEGRLEDADRLRRQQVERARYETDLARSRYMHVDPNNRLVADELEREWNKKLTALTQAQQEYERRRQQDRLQLNEEARARILSLAADVPKLWADPKTPQRERKQVVRFVIEDATVLKNDAGLALQIRFKGGATRTLSLPAPKTAWEERQTKAEVVAEIDRLLNDHTFREIAGILNERRLVSGTGRSFHGDRVEYLCRFYKLKPRFDRLRAAGLLTLDELAAKLGRSKGTIKLWRLRETLPVRAHKLDDNGRHMYEDPCRGGPRGARQGSWLK